MATWKAFRSNLIYIFLYFSHNIYILPWAIEIVAPSKEDFVWKKREIQ